METQNLLEDSRMIKGLALGNVERGEVGDCDSDMGVCGGRWVEGGDNNTDGDGDGDGDDDDGDGDVADNDGDSVFTGVSGDWS